MACVKNLFQNAKPHVIGMIHVGALPGTPKSKLSINSIIDQACKEAEMYKDCNVDSILIENMHDVPYVQSKRMGPEIVASMTRICTEVRKILPSLMKCGVQILAGANKEALAVAQAANLQFVRAEGFVYSHVADEGFMDSCAGELLRYRNQIGAHHISIFTDIKKKHCSHSITQDVTLEETAKAAEFFLSNGLILTGRSTGDAVPANDLHEVKRHTSLPVLIGSGATPDNVKDFLQADAIIVGSYFKMNGLWSNDVDMERVKLFMNTLEMERKKRN